MGNINGAPPAWPTRVATNRRRANRQRVNKRLRSRARNCPRSTGRISTAELYFARRSPSFTELDSPSARREFSIIKTFRCCNSTRYLRDRGGTMTNIFIAGLWVMAVVNTVTVLKSRLNPRIRTNGLDRPKRVENPAARTITQGVGRANPIIDMIVP